MYLIETSRGPVFGIEGVVSVPPKAFPAAETRNHYLSPLKARNSLPTDEESNEGRGDLCVARVFE